MCTTGANLEYGKQDGVDYSVSLVFISHDQSIYHYRIKEYSCEMMSSLHYMVISKAEIYLPRL